MQPEPANLTELVNLWKRGDHAAGDVLFDAVQLRLRKVANKLLFERGGFHRVQATEVVNEAYLRLLRERKECISRSEFISIAIRLIDRTILDAMRYDRAEVRDFRVELNDQEPNLAELVDEKNFEVESLSLKMDHLDRALDDLGAENQVAYLVLMRKVFNEETLRSIAGDLKISEDAAGRKWTFARAFLASRLAELSQPLKRL